MRLLLPMRLLLLAAAPLVAAGCDTADPGNGPPRAAEVLRVTVSAAPLADPGGDGWDGGAGGGPEVYFRLFDDVVDYQTDPGDDRLNPRDDGNVFPLGASEPWFDDVETLDFPLVWDVDPGYLVRDLDDPLYVALFDYDPTSGDDPMGATESVALRDAAPARASDNAVIIRLDGFDRNDDPSAAVRVSLTVRYLD